MNFYMNFSNGLSAEEINNGYIMKFTLGTGADAKVSDSIIYENENGLYYQCKVFASEMSETIVPELYIKGETEPICTFEEYSVKTYLDNQLLEQEGKSEAEKDTELINLLNATMQYGSTSQMYFDGTAMDGVEEPVGLADVELSTLVNAYPKYAASYTQEGKITLSGMTLVLFAETALRAGFELSEGYTMKNFAFSAYKVDSIGAVISTITDGYTGIYKNVDYFDIPNIKPDELDDIYKIVVSDKESGNEILSMTYSPFTYIARKLNVENPDADTQKLQKVVTAMYRYNQAAEAYVAK